MMQIEIESQAPTHVTARRFYFPAWQLDGGAMALEPTEKYRLASFTAPAGRTTVRLRRSALTEEKWGWAISGASLLLLLAMAAFSARIVLAEEDENWRSRSSCARASARSTGAHSKGSQ